MKKFQFLAATTLLLLVACTNSNAQTAEEIVCKHLEAIGGEANWKKVNSMITKGSLHADHQEYGYYNTVLNGKGERKEFTGGPMTAYEIITPTKAWGYVPQAGLTVSPEAIPDLMLKKFLPDLDLQGTLVDYKAKGNKVSYLGKTEFEGVVCYKLEVESQGGRHEIMYIDTSSYYRIGSGVSVVEHGTLEEQHTAKYGNFKKLPEGIVVPMDFNLGDGPVKLDQVKINKPVDEKIFDPFDKSVHVHY
jgi:hypothetical protein